MAVRAVLKMAMLKSRKRAYEVAEEAGIDETRLSRIVTGRMAPTYTEKNSLATVLGATVHQLFGEETAEVSPAKQGTKPKGSVEPKKRRTNSYEDDEAGMDASDVLALWASKAGWDEHSQIALLCEYIDTLADSELHLFLRERAEEEEELGDVE